jgi:hypothetical protein
VLSENLYWQSKDEASQQRLNTLAAQPVAVSIKSAASSGERALIVSLMNRGKAAALNAKLTLVDAQGHRVLPVYYSDNYISLLPGQQQQVEVHFPASFAGASMLQLRGWNVRPIAVPATQ